MVVANETKLDPGTILAFQKTVGMRDLLMRRRPLAIAWFLVLMLLREQTSARAGACQSYEAAYNIEAGMREGMSLKQAQESVVQEEYSDGSADCMSAIKEEVNQMPYAFPLLHRALFKRIRR